MAPAPLVWLQWTRYRGIGRAFWIVLLLAAGLVCVAFQIYGVAKNTDVPGAITKLLTLPVQSISAANLTPGPARYVGHLQGLPAPHPPLADPSAAWSVWITREYKRGKTTYTEQLCGVTYAAPLRLTHGARSIDVGFDTKMPVSVLGRHALRARSASTEVQMDLGTPIERTTVPDTLYAKRDCPSLGTFKTGVDYYEASINQGAEVEVTGCYDAKKNAIVSCDGAPLTVSLRGADAIAGAWRKDAIGWIAWPLFLGLVAALVSWGLASASLVRLRTRHDAKPVGAKWEGASS